VRLLRDSGVAVSIVVAGWRVALVCGVLTWKNTLRAEMDS